MPRYKRPRRRAQAHRAGRDNGGRHTLVPIQTLGDEDPLVHQEEKRVDRALRTGYCIGEFSESEFLRLEVDPRLMDLWFRKLGAAAAAVQARAFAVALRPDATHHEIRNGVTAAREVQDRLYGRAVEKIAVAGRVRVEFGGLNPDVFPQQDPSPGQTEIIEISGAAGTEIPGEEADDGGSIPETPSAQVEREAQPPRGRGEGADPDPDSASAPRGGDRQAASGRDAGDAARGSAD